jgi:site-specific DNA-methyltransferase (adenine-specific)
MASIDLILTDPPYNLGKDYGNGSDQQSVEAYLRLDRAVDRRRAAQAEAERQPVHLPDLALRAGDLRDAEKAHDDDERDHLGPPRAVDGRQRAQLRSVHDTIGFFVAARIIISTSTPCAFPYDAETKKARSRSIFVGAKWLEVGYNPKDLWSVSRLHREHPERADHPTQKPLEIIERMLKASCPPGGVVLDLFMGSGTTAIAAKRCGRHFVGFELNPDYCAIIANGWRCRPVPRRPTRKRRRRAQARSRLPQNEVQSTHRRK